MIKYLELKRINDRYEVEIQQAIEQVLQRGWYLKGEATRQFEKRYAAFIGTKYCIGCGNGLDALTLLLRGYKEMGLLHDGDEVIVPANTFIATILAITENNLKPVFVEPDIHTLQIDDTLIEQAVTPKTRAVMIVHLYGRCAYTPRIADICHKYGLLLFEDNAQAHGCTANVQCSMFRSTSGRLQSKNVQSQRTGSLGNAAAHSFYPGKNLGALGDAGAITTDDAQLADVVSALGNYGSQQKYVHDYAGRNSRMDEIQAAVLSVKLNHLDQINARRKELASLYINNVENSLIHIPKSERDCVWHIFPVFCEQRDALQQFLRSNGVETLIHYPIPPHKQRCYAKWNDLSLPVTERLSAQELSLPCNEAMTNQEVLSVVEVLNAFTV